ncbi:hypothetical protein ASPZODRAFT_1166595 [Penicilliopsis zonata CBS 506.65]|uniref:Methyltransferase type 11 domain-containing protein n=1 Tax=Penicilliopsis zonata CBS 506.65 TaxID=1073090 RepID=A0A1L9STE5_9EURO|nr:hypothetical protein ASPZODRAFT_1166595 [Penicilliopsis zonata CBS 506.65]OJJ50406.1 hypothetical protein ASPZODRAFT_1166595 [Penicilliopsis zonata CBS 506.65]
MSTSTIPSTTTAMASEKTFLAYTPSQGKVYAEARRDYHRSVYDAVLSYHTSGGGELDTLLDIGCGPGTATRRLGGHFEHAIGLDASAGMVETARTLGGTTATGEKIRFEVSTSDKLVEGDCCVDVIVAATAAHWFEMSSFWRRAAQVLRPGGSVALWCSGESSVHSSTPNAGAIQAALERIREEERLDDFFEEGNRLVRAGYVDLPLPWTVEPGVQGFERASFVRREWGFGDEFYAGQMEVDLDTFEKVLGTASPITRWREAHRDAVGSERDIVRRYRRAIETLLHEAGVQPGQERVRGAVTGVLLMVRRT